MPLTQRIDLTAARVFCELTLTLYCYKKQLKLGWRPRFRGPQNPSRVIFPHPHSWRNGLKCEGNIVSLSYSTKEKARLDYSELRGCQCASRSLQTLQQRGFRQTVELKSHASCKKALPANFFQMRFPPWASEKQISHSTHQVRHCLHQPIAPCPTP